ncbi:N-acetylmuramate alpha-1-phosphate uridylyltransferase MurU [Methylomonas sp. AM2-LC]|uniref:N-acetylmuramate alpha-1-phosphate uridylyltransferase MurU n=1 Tax=Methylomonas sp. AM2-LC TaxID=3153301 RepID=UPI003265DE29
MKAMILAAGRGERMRPLTDTIPKPLLKVGGKPLIQHTIENLQLAGFKQIVINLAHLGQQIREYCGNGERWNVSIDYTDEGDAALETAGGIANALPLLGEKPFLVVNADIICDYPLVTLRNRKIDLAHLVLIENPVHHPQGDFSLTSDGLLSADGREKFTFSGIGVYHPDMFQNLPVGPLKLRPVLDQAIQKNRISGEKYLGIWMDIGTPQRLTEIDNLLRVSK